MAGVSTAGIVTGGTLMEGTLATGVVMLGVLTLGSVTLGVLTLGTVTGASVGGAGAAGTTFTGSGTLGEVGVDELPGDDDTGVARPGSPVPMVVVAGTSGEPVVGPLATEVARGACTGLGLLPGWTPAARLFLAGAASCRLGPVAGAAASADRPGCERAGPGAVFRWAGAWRWRAGVIVSRPAAHMAGTSELDPARLAPRLVEAA